MDYAEASLYPRPQDAQSVGREPFAYTHNVHKLDLFSRDSLEALARRYVADDYFVASGAPSPHTPFYAVEHGRYTPSSALAALDVQAQRILLKRPEKYDQRFRALLATLFERVVELRGGLGAQRIVRLDSSILISSAQTLTPFHFDPELSFFFQIEGEKSYHLYSPAVLAEPELERFYVKGIVNIGEVGVDGRDPALESIFELEPGKGMHQPQNAPHWVETRATRSVSYVFSFETDVTRAIGRTRSCNHYLRQIGLRPAPLGRSRTLDAFKAGAMHVAIPARKRLGTALRWAWGNRSRRSESRSVS